jgi:hypothetical protein
MIEDWCRDELRKNAKLWRLPADEDRWPNPRAVPSVWAWMSYKVTRIFVVAAEALGTSRVDRNDVIDRELFSDAAYADVLVTDDTGVHRIAYHARTSGVTPIRFGDFCHLVLRGTDLRQFSQRSA